MFSGEASIPATAFAIASTTNCETLIVRVWREGLCPERVQQGTFMSSTAVLTLAIKSTGAVQFKAMQSGLRCVFIVSFLSLFFY